MIDFNFLNISVLIIFGFFIGILGSVMGVGGGVFIVPLLSIFFHLPIQNAIAISLVAIIVTSTTVATVNVEKGLANVRLGISLEMTMALGSIIGALLMTRLNGRWLSILFALFLFPVSISMYLKSKNKFPLKQKTNKDTDDMEKKNVYGSSFFDPSVGEHINYFVDNMSLAMLFSLFSGALSGLLGLGGGIIQVPVMNLICKIPIKAAAATSNFMIGVSAATSTIIFFKKGFIIEDIAIILSLGVALGSIIGIKTLYKAKSDKIQLAFSVLIIAVAIKMLYNSLYI